MIVVNPLVVLRHNLQRNRISENAVIRKTEGTVKIIFIFRHLRVTNSFELN